MEWKKKTARFYVLLLRCITYCAECVLNIAVCCSINMLGQSAQSALRAQCSMLIAANVKIKLPKQLIFVNGFMIIWIWSYYIYFHSFSSSLCVYECALAGWLYFGFAVIQRSQTDTVSQGMNEAGSLRAYYIVVFIHLLFKYLDFI